MKTPLVISENEALNGALFNTFKNTKNILYRNEIFSLMMEAEMQLKMAFDPKIPFSFIKRMQKIRGIWARLQSMLLLAEMLEICSATAAEKCLKKLESVQKISYGLMRYIEARKTKAQNNSEIGS
jgi:hypothetical protein